MSKQFRNSLCACGSGKKHKNCCKPLLDRGFYEQTEEVVKESVIGADHTVEKKNEYSDFKRGIDNQCEEVTIESLPDGGSLAATKCC